jgi:Tfp pilus assembly protein PilX
MLLYEKNKQLGFTLIVALIFLQIITILGLYAVESAIQAEKMSRLNEQKKVIFFNAEQVLHSIETKLLKEIPSCLIPITPSSELISKTLEWWQSSARCVGIFQLFEYYYVVEKLGSPICVNIDPFNLGFTRNNMGEYFRITLLVLDKKNESREMLQSTIITLDNALQSCDSDHHVILGRQMWRELGGGF